MSGGVDSSVAAALLVEQGYDVLGVTLRMWEGTLGPRVCSDHRGASDIAASLGIPHTLLDLRAQFADAVVKPFAADYLSGRTPNPCVACNRDFKLGTLLRWAKEQGARYVVTGHYARVVHRAEQLSLLRGLDSDKDQSYFLFALSQEQLGHIIFPLGEMHKTDVRASARRFGLPVAERPESQDICFGDYRSLVESYAAGEEIPGGDIVDRNGKVLGQHNGVHRVTVGQRRGLGVAASQPLYVLEIEEHSKRVVVGQRDQLYSSGLAAERVNWIEQPAATETEAEVQIRYRAPAIPCTVRLTENGCDVRFRKPRPAVTPGQAAVFYRGDRVLGGGWIASALKS